MKYLTLVVKQQPIMKDLNGDLIYTIGIILSMFFLMSHVVFQNIIIKLEENVHEV